MHILSKLLLPLLAITLLSQAVWAQEILESEQFRLELPPLSSQPFIQAEPTPADKNKKNETDESALIFRKKGVMIKTGLPHTTDTAPFIISLSPAIIDYQPLTPDSPILKQAKITIDPGSSRGYILTMRQDTPLTNANGMIINNTFCNTNMRCDIFNAAPWKNADSYGFGYSLHGDDISADFKNQTYFRPLATKSFAENPVIIMSAIAASDPREAIINFKLVIDKDKPAGVYANTINLMVLPRY